MLFVRGSGRILTDQEPVTVECPAPKELVGHNTPEIDQRRTSIAGSQRTAAMPFKAAYM